MIYGYKAAIKKHDEKLKEFNTSTFELIAAFIVLSFAIGIVMLKILA